MPVGHVGRDVADELEALLVRASASGLSASPITERSEKATASSSSLRDSIFEKSRMSLRMASSESAET